MNLLKVIIASIIILGSTINGKAQSNNVLINNDATRASQQPISNILAPLGLIQWNKAATFNIKYAKSNSQQRRFSSIIPKTDCKLSYMKEYNLYVLTLNLVQKLNENTSVNLTGMLVSGSKRFIKTQNTMEILEIKTIFKF